MWCRKHIIFGILLCLCAWANKGFAQSGAVSGIVKDAEENMPIIGANIYLEGSGLGTISDIDGRFTLTGLPEGDQVLVVSYISYRTEQIPITLAAGGKKIISEISY